MGQSIAAAIPLTFKPHNRFGIETRDFSDGFFKSFDMTEQDGAKIYTIKSDLLIQNYKSFLLEFYELIGVDLKERTKIDPESIPEANDIEEFISAFDGDVRNNRVPFIYDTYIAFSTLGGITNLYWLFYSSGGKALLEEYSAFLHFERILSKTMQNPLAGVVKFGLFG